MQQIERIRGLAEPIARDQSVDLIDVEHLDGVVRVTIDQAGGVGIDEISRVTRALSRALDEADPVPGRYTLEVSSPGIERPLRAPGNFQRAIGATVALKTRAEVAGDRRCTGQLVAADDEGITVRDSETLVERRLRYGEIDKARTVFEWGPAPKPGAGRNPKNQKQHPRKAPTP